MKQLSIRSDEAYRLARAIAQETDQPIVQVVVAALRNYAAELPANDGMTPGQRATYEALTALSRKTAKGKKPGATSDHSDMYDEFGLPI